MATTAVFLCGHLGALSVILNLFVIIALLRHRRRVLSNVFYVIVLHCAILDVARGICLIMYGLPYFANSIYKINLDITTRISLFRASTFALVVLRICNLLTIFNLLVFTTNEYIVIRYPLHYRRYFRRKFVLIILAVCWIVSTIMGCGLLIPSSNTAYLKELEPQERGIDLATLTLVAISSLCFVTLGIVVICYITILRTIRKFKDEGCLNNDESHRIHNRSIHRIVNGQGSNGSTGSRGSKWRSVQAMSRHKYIYVIGSVLIVDLLFLCPYSGIQMVAFLHINNLIEITHGSTLIRWWLQVLIGVHSVCQPLCYFRMTEFRRLACCNPRRPWNRTKSFSQMNKSFANTRSNVQVEDNAVNGNEPLLKNGENGTPSRRSPTAVWTRGESVRFRTYGNDFAHHAPTGKSNGSATPSPKPQKDSPRIEMELLPISTGSASITDVGEPIFMDDAPLVDQL
uniref:G_PROTEIN_RECEP_F1_2 domain-containing protein n=1 Tax=Caenorhabditis japonica TaxID=281687 RepID=A0A8R1HTN8_CAEJA